MKVSLSCLSILLLILHEKSVSFHINHVNKLQLTKLNSKVKKLSDSEWEQLKKAIDEQKDDWQLAMKNKKTEWQMLKSSGALDSLTDSNIDEEAIERLDELTSQLRQEQQAPKTSRLIKRRKTSLSINNDSDKSNIGSTDDLDSKQTDLSSIKSSDNDDEVEETLDNLFSSLDTPPPTTTNTQSLPLSSSSSYTTPTTNTDDNSLVKTSLETTLQYKLNTLLSNPNTTAITIFSFLNEVKDKSIYNIPLIENILLALPKYKSDSTALSAYKIYDKLLVEKLLTTSTQSTASLPSSSTYDIAHTPHTPYTYNPRQFLLKYVMSLYIHGLHIAGDKIKDILLAQSQSQVQEESSINQHTDKSSIFQPEDFFIAELCALITQSSTTSTHTNNKPSSVTSTTSTKATPNPRKSPSSRSKPTHKSIAPSINTGTMTIALRDKLTLFYSNMKAYSLPEINTVLR